VWPRSAFALTCSLLTACGNGPATPVAQRGAALIHGEDQRREVFALDDELQKLALGSSVALVSTSGLMPAADGGIALRSPPARELYNLCADEAFADQPAAALCSGILTTDSIVVTAGHCATLLPCAEQAWVFGYALAAPQTLRELHSEDLYTCRAVLAARRETDATGRRWDYAAIQLDRAVQGDKHPLAVSSAPPALGDPVQVIGYPAGLPLKIDGPVQVVNTRSTLDYFTLDSDTFDRNSGSAVIDATGSIVGIFVRGGQDYEFREAESCWASRRFPDSAAAESVEQASYMPAALTELLQRKAATVRTGSNESSAAQTSGCAIGIGSKAKAWAFDNRAWLGLLLLAAAQIRRTLRKRGARFVTNHCQRGH